MHKWIMFVLFIGATVFGLTAMVSAVDKHAKENAPEDTGGKPQLKIEASNWQFNKPEFTVKSGDTVKVSLALKEGIHEVHISGYDVKLDKNNPAAEIKFDKPGEYEIRCVLPCGPTDKHAGMVSKLIVQ